MDQPEFRLREIWPPGTVIKDDYIYRARTAVSNSIHRIRLRLRIAG